MISFFEKNKLCSACQAGKQDGNTHPTKSVMCTSRPLELLHMDLFGPTTYRSIGENIYGLVVVDDYSRYTWVLFLSDKSNVFSIFKGLGKKLKMNLISKSRRLEVIMTPS
jgi:transposase InsO family protein